MDIKPIGSNEIRFPTRTYIPKKEDMVEEPDKDSFIPKWTNTTIIVFPKCNEEFKDGE